MNSNAVAGFLVELAELTFKLALSAFVVIALYSVAKRWLHL